MNAVESSSVIRDAVRDGVSRAAAAVGLAGIALIHLLDAPSKFSETPYLGWMYVGLIVASVAFAGALVHTSDGRVWSAALVLTATVIAGYVLSRTTGLPQATGDVGNWGEPLGMASLLVEGSVVGVCAAAVLMRRTGRQRVGSRGSYELPARGLRAA
jgi:hypothetical protein